MKNISIRTIFSQFSSILPECSCKWVRISWALSCRERPRYRSSSPRTQSMYSFSLISIASTQNSQSSFLLFSYLISERSSSILDSMGLQVATVSAPISLMISQGLVSSSFISCYFQIEGEGVQRLPSLSAYSSKLYVLSQSFFGQGLGLGLKKVWMDWRFVLMGFGRVSRVSGDEVSFGTSANISQIFPLSKDFLILSTKLYILAQPSIVVMKSEQEVREALTASARLLFILSKQSEYFAYFLGRVKSLFWVWLSFSLRMGESAPCYYLQFMRQQYRLLA